MAETFQNFERHCRLCAEEQEVTLKLFSSEASDMLLVEKLRKYLLIEIGENDILPKNICIKCCTKLQTLSEFIELVRKAQGTLHALRSTIDMLDSSLTTIKAIEEETTEFTEICIDPMDVLNMSDEAHTEQYKYPYADEVVTLKLIPKNLNEDENNQDKKKFVCNVCNKGFVVEQSLKNHSWTHIQDEEYSCFVCQRSYRFEIDLNEHMKTHRPSVFSWQCEICGRRFKTQFTYDTHMQIHKESTKSYTCNICGRSYGNGAGLKTHHITHSTEKPFQCSLCNKRFKRNQELKFHMNHHTGEKPYKCKFCEKCFASTGNLYTHKNRAHSNNANRVPKSQKTQSANQTISAAKEPMIKLKYQCEICRKSCRRQENYLYHMFQHTGQKPFKCTQCTQQFITQRSLSSHYGTMHPNINKPAMPVPVFCRLSCKWL